MDDNLKRFNLNDSQRSAVKDCLSMRQSDHIVDPIKLVWGPPGTGKTKTISILLLALLKQGCRTLTCAPTNTAVVEIASRLYKLLDEKSMSKVNFSTGDIVIFGNSTRMKIDDDLSQIFLEHRTKRLLEKCFMPITGWRHLIGTMIDFLSNAAPQYKQYVRKINEENDENKFVTEVMTVMSFNEYVLKQCRHYARKLEECVEVMSKDLPRSIISDTIFRYMNMCIVLMIKFKTFLISAVVTDEDLEELFESTDEKSNEMLHLDDPSRYFEYLATPIGLRKCRTFLLQVLMILSRDFHLPNLYDSASVQEFCLQNTTIIFCTACGSFNLHNIEMMKRLNFLIVDEAAQLKECESLIPLQISGIENVVLIGDEFQLPAMVKSQVMIFLSI